jgi:hypothetical protein
MKKLLSILFCVVVFASCKKQSEEIQIVPISDYAPLSVGKYITYSLDSLVYANFGTVETHRYYEVKYQVQDSITDNLGRKAFRMIRYIRTLPSGTFVADNTALAVNTGSKYELMENNIRYFKLTLPIADGNSWKGNAAIALIVNPATGEDLSYLADWDYTYENVGAAKKVGTFNLANTLTVNQKNDSTNLPITPTTLIANKDFSQEVYAKDIGMVYRNFLHFEYQKNGATFSYKGYGVKLTMIDHN